MMDQPVRHVLGMMRITLSLDISRVNLVRLGELSSRDDSGQGPRLHMSSELGSSERSLIRMDR